MAQLQVSSHSCVVQYACMFISAGEAGNAKKIQASVAAARKVFRVFRVSAALNKFFAASSCAQGWPHKAAA